MTNRAARATKLTDLPLELQSRIISFLSRTYSRKPIQLSLDALGHEFKRHEQEIERDLLAVAKASSLLALATANVLADRAICLSSSTALELLPEWIEAFAPFVRAVTTKQFRTIPSSWNVRRGVHLDHRFMEDQPPPPSRHQNDPLLSSHYLYYPSGKCPSQLKDWLSGTVLHLCKSLSLDSLSLVVLDLKHIYFHEMNITCDHISRQLETAIQSNSHSLKELSLQCSEPCAQALTRVTLNNLSKMELAFYFEDHSIDSSTIWLGHMLHAMDGLADREQGISTVSELRISCDWLLGSSDESLLVDAEFVGASLRDSVKILEVDGFDWSELHLDDAIKFVCLFDSLECLTWHHVIFPRHVREIKTQCQSFRELCIYPYHSPQVGDAIAFEEIFTVCNGTLKTLIAHEVLSVGQIRTLRSTNNDLRRITLRVERDSVPEVVALLRSCKRLQSFHLLTADFKDERIFEGFGADSLEKITRAMCSIESRDLEEVIIELDGRLWLEEYRIQPAMKSMQDVVNFLGERAKVVRYTASTRCRGEFKAIIEGLCAILRTCRLKAWNMKELNANFDVDGPVDIGDAEATEMLQQLKKEREKLVECVPNLHSLSLGRELEMMQI